MENFEYICPKCGETDVGFPTNEIHYCRFCKTQLIETKYNTKETMEHIKNGTYSDFEARLFNEYVKDNPLYDPDEATRSYAKRQAAHQRQEAQYRQEREAADKTPKCPNCKSTNICKIGTVERGVSVATFGLFSGKLGKTMKCNKCGYKW